MSSFLQRLRGFQKAGNPDTSSLYAHDKANSALAEGLLHPGQVFRREDRERSTRAWLIQLLWVSFALLQVANLVLLVQWKNSHFGRSGRPAISSFEHLSTRPPTSDLDVGEDRNGITPKFPTIDIKFNYISTDFFVPGPEDDNITALVWDEWTHLLPKGNGLLRIDNHKDYPHLTDPYFTKTDISREKPLYQPAWVHQLHCLYFIMKEYHRILHHGPDGTEYFIDENHNHYHASHCFNYIRQAIVCYADPTLEGIIDEGPLDGSGQTHVCKDREEMYAWYEARRQFDFQAIDEHPPEGATLAPSKD